MGYGLSFLLLLLTVVLLLSSIALNATLSFLEGRLAAFIDIPWTAIGLTGTAVTFVVLSALLTMLYRFLPKVRFPVRDIVIGALLTAALMMLSAWLFTAIVTIFPIGRSYGIAATLLVLLLWIDVMAMIFFLGAEILNCSRINNDRKVQNSDPLSQK